MHAGNQKMYEPNKILEQFEEVSKPTIFDSFCHWQNNHREILKKLQIILNETKVDLIQNEEWATSPKLLWQDFESKAVNIISCIKSFRYIPDNLSIDTIANCWYDKFNTVFKDLPQEIRILIGNSFWHSKPSERFITRIRKKIQPVRRWLTIKGNSIANLFRKHKGQPAVILDTNERHIMLHHMIRNYIELPLRTFLSNEWQHYLRAISGQYFVIHRKIDELFNKALLLDKFEDIVNPAEKINIFDRLFTLAEILKNLDETLETLSVYEKQFKHRLDNRWEEIREQFLHAWSIAGTFQLQNQKFSQSLLSSKVNKIESKFRYHINFWTIHLTGLQREWQKDLELAILQFRVAQILVETSQLIHDKTETVINPAYTEILSLIENAQDEICKENNEKVSKQMFINTCNTLLKTLPEVKLPKLLNVLYQARLIPVLEEYSMQIESSMESLANTYSIYKKRDTKNSPPKSSLDDIALKDMVKKEILAELLQNQYDFVDRTRSKQEEMFRKIAKIDQSLEFNLETALNLTRNGKGDIGYAEAKRIVSEGLERSTAMINELVNQTEFIASDSKTHLLEDALKFEYEIEKLTDTNKIEELKNRFYRHKRHEKFKQSLVELSTFIGSAIPSLILKPLSLLRKIWKNYFSSKKAFVNGDSENISEDRIIQFLNDTNDKISQLPYVYRKLFEFEPLHEERLYTKRESEMKLLQIELGEWQNGNRNVTAVIGEMGSGRTTFLHFAEKQVLSPYPITKINVNETVYGKENMCKMLKNAFNIKNIDSLDDIEDHLLSENDPRICIVENLQNLFLREVDSLNNLERFLLMVNKTQDKIFWVFSCTVYAWQFLEKSIGISNYFKRIITLGAHSNEEIQSIILKRHRLSGYALVFDSNGDIKHKRKFRKSNSEENRQKDLKDLFFKKLNRLSTGNITIAIMYWLRSIKQFSADEVVISSHFDFNYSFLYKLPTKILFSMAAFVHHEVLSAKDHAIICRQSVDQSMVKLRQMQHSGLLIKKEGGYQIHPFLYSSLVQVLKSKNILH
jgi:hypothetical protein